MDNVPDEVEGGAVDLRDGADAAEPQPAAPPEAPAASEPVRAQVINSVLDGMVGPAGPASARLAEFVDEEHPGRAL